MLKTFVLLGMLAGLAACATAEGQQQALNGNRKLTVTVDHDSRPCIPLVTPDRRCQDQDDADICVLSGSKLTWTLNGEDDDVEFFILFREESRFEAQCRSKSKNRKFECKLKGDITTGEFKYDVYVGSCPYVLDPRIIIRDSV